MDNEDAKKEDEGFSFNNILNSKEMVMDFQLAKDLFEKEFIIWALRQNKGKINQTALKANIPKKTLLRKIEKYEIVAKTYSNG
jgi:DNA-binding NtrC family response regulator